MQNSDPAEDYISGINITPLVDVFLVLLIIFMATAPLIHRRAINVNVPKAAYSEPKATSTLKISFNENREIFLDNKEVTKDELKYQLTAMVRADPFLHVALLADQVVPYGDVISILDIIRGAGVKKLALEVRAKKLGD